MNYKRKEKENISNYKIIEVLGSEKEPEFEFFNNVHFNRIPGLHLVINQTSDGLTFNFYYHIERFDKSTILRWSDEFTAMLDEIIFDLINSQMELVFNK
ncbi:hypothetical protein [Mesobacillus zeae]|uniref:hypothetical protein n=1 Tax=Mesobacillus zeae TaxID=1917180 RepID=UPI0015E697E2|nr:hypothetical protein [Mesobacillus zeae]